MLIVLLWINCEGPPKLTIDANRMELRFIQIVRYIQILSGSNQLFDSLYKI